MNISNIANSTTKAIKIINGPRNHQNGSLPLVEDFIDFDNEITPYLVTLLVSGVGSGKTRWLAKLAKEGKKVLEITSRRSTANEQRVSTDALSDITSIFTNALSEKKICVLTNAQVALYVKYNYLLDPLIDLFDIICLDEAHSLVSDASFADSPFYVKKFFKNAIKYIHKKDAENKNKKPTCHFVFMTGTPEPIEYLFEYNNKNGLFQYKYFKNCYNRIDLFDDTKHVVPDRVTLISKISTAFHLRELLERDQKVIYFVRTIENLYTLTKFLTNLGFDETCIGIDFSDEEKCDKFSDTLLEQRKALRTELANNRKLPDNIKVFITTTRNKEGINIENTDFHCVFVESAVRADIQQMAGRLRNYDSYDMLYVVYNEYWGKTAALDFAHMVIEKSILETGIPMYLGLAAEMMEYDVSKCYSSCMSMVCDYYDLEEHFKWKMILDKRWYIERECSFKQRKDVSGL